jgi:hypothetical protein
MKAFRKAGTKEMRCLIRKPLAKFRIIPILAVTGLLSASQAVVKEIDLTTSRDADANAGGVEEWSTLVTVADGSNTLLLLGAVLLPLGIIGLMRVRRNLSRNN